ncbi:hypothetical protein PG991_005006 [Apiospora marii]|uniref:Uncharacterized protein n=1 Tax=Apiospora marii TaxID=335849 RepID=A0ABR1S7X9_9PEZI
MRTKAQELLNGKRECYAGETCAPCGAMPVMITPAPGPVQPSGKGNQSSSVAAAAAAVPLRRPSTTGLWRHPCLHCSGPPAVRSRLRERIGRSDSEKRRKSKPKKQNSKKQQQQQQQQQQQKKESQTTTAALARPRSNHFFLVLCNPMTGQWPVPSSTATQQPTAVASSHNRRQATYS